MIQISLDFENFLRRPICLGRQHPWEVKMFTTKAIIKTIDGYDRELEESAEGTFSGCKTYAVAGLEDKPGKRVPKAGALCEAGVGRVRITDSLLEAEAKGPNASAGAEANVFGVEANAQAGVGSASATVGPYDILGAEVKGPNVSAGAEANIFKVGAMARAEAASVSGNIGPIGAKLGLAIDTGVSAGIEGLEVKLLGTGVKFGPQTSISVLGSELSCSVM